MNSSSCMHHLLAVVMFIEIKILFCLKFELPRVQPNDKEKRLAYEVFNTLAAYFGLVHDATGTECWAQSGSIHGHFHNIHSDCFLCHSCDASLLQFPSARSFKLCLMAVSFTVLRQCL